VLRRSLLSLRFFWQDHPLLSGALAALLAAAAVAVPFRVWRARRGVDVLGRGRREPRTVVIQAYAALCGLLRRRGRHRRPAQTPLEFVAALESDPTSRPGMPLPPGILEPIRALSHTFMSARYGPGPITDDMAAAAARRLAEVRESLRRRTSRASDPNLPQP
jgi:hypothetical protein